MKKKKKQKNLFPSNFTNNGLLNQPGDYFHIDITKSGKTVGKTKQGKNKRCVIYYPSTGTLVTIQSKTFEPNIEDDIYDNSDYDDDVILEVISNDYDE